MEHYAISKETNLQHALHSSSVCDLVTTDGGKKKGGEKEKEAISVLRSRGRSRSRSSSGKDGCRTLQHEKLKAKVVVASNDHLIRSTCCVDPI